MNPVIKRTTIVVRDAEASRVFYEDILGLKPFYDREFVFTGAMPGTNEGDKSRLIILEAQDPQIGKIGLLQFTEPEKQAPAPADTIKVGSVVFVGSVADVDGLYGRLQTAGHAVASPPHDFTVTGADGQKKSMRRICFFDPDGNFLELSEAPK